MINSFSRLADIFFASLLLFFVPIISVLNTYSSKSNIGSSQIFEANSGLNDFVNASMPTVASTSTLLVFFGIISVFYWIPGKFVHGPLTPTGHVPVYVENGMAHLILSSLCFFGGSYFDLFPMSILFDNIHAMVCSLNVFSILFCIFLYWKALNFPSTPDVMKSGNGILYDFYSGLELYPNIFGYDVKKLINCRFSMTFWMLFGASCASASFRMHGTVDYSLIANAVSTFLYLVTFFLWETGYMKSIDIIEDNAGFMETWGCLVFVPAVYTTHMHAAVYNPSELSGRTVATLFAINIACIFFTLWTNKQREIFRKTDGKSMLWWPSPPKAIYVKYQVSTSNPLLSADPFIARTQEMTSILLCNGFWGIVRHPQYVFELGIAFTWGLLGNPFQNGLKVMLYPFFLTILLVHRAFRDRRKCRRKYGQGYSNYEQLVPYMIFPGIL